MSNVKLVSAAVVALLALAGGQGIANAQESAAVPMRAAASYERCDHGMQKSLVGGARAWIPAHGGHWRCWLNIDQSRKNRAVVVLQESILRAEKVPVTIDGYYGPGTKSAVRTVQYKRHLETDGIYGPNTGWSMYWKAINGTVAKWW